MICRSQGLTGVRIGIILQALSAMITALVIGFSSSWKLTLIVVCFVPLMMFTGVLQGQKQGKAGQSKEQGSFTEQGGEVCVCFSTDCQLELCVFVL